MMTTTGGDRAPRAFPLPIDPAARQLADRVARVFGFEYEDLLVKHRTPSLVHARQMASWVLHYKLGLSYYAIGRLLGQDHATIIHAIRKIESNPSYVERARRLKESLG